MRMLDCSTHTVLRHIIGGLQKLLESKFAVFSWMYKLGNALGRSTGAVHFFMAYPKTDVIPVRRNT